MTWTCFWCDHQVRHRRETCPLCGSPVGSAPKYTPVHMLRELRDICEQEDVPYVNPRTDGAE